MRVARFIGTVADRTLLSAAMVTGVQKAIRAYAGA